MKEFFSAIYDELSAGQDVVLVSIIASSGSTPRGNGAKMAVFADGRSIGTIGGGAVEHESQKLAMEVFRQKASRAQGYNLAPNQTADIGMICGGKVVVYFQYFAGGDRAALALFSAIVSLYDKNIDSWLITAIREGAVWSMGTYDEENGLRFTDAIAEETLAPMLKSCAVLLKEDPGYYVEPLVQSGSVYVFGGGHVSQELVPVIAHIGFRTVVFEDRPDFASHEMFSAAAEIVLGSFQDIEKTVSIGKRDYVVIMTRGHQADQDVLKQALRTEASYIGVIGSKHKIATTFLRLYEAGFTEADTRRVHTPIGLGIKAETPAEIAISIAGELILHRAEEAIR